MKPVEWKQRIAEIGKYAKWHPDLIREYVAMPQSFEVMHKMAWAEDEQVVLMVRQLCADVLAGCGVVASRRRSKRPGSYLIPELSKKRDG